MNILICSAGRRVKLVSYFKEELNKFGGKVIAADCDETAPALYYADEYEVIPPIQDGGYLARLLEIGRKHRIDAVLSLIDPELVVLAEHREAFEKENMKVIVSSFEVVSLCFDKYLTAGLLAKNGLPYVPTFLPEGAMEAVQKGLLHFPVIVKPRRGSASIRVQKVSSLKELSVLLEAYDDLIVQPYISGEEYGVDCYIDLINKETTNIFAKRKLKMRAGETDKSIAVKDPELIDLISRLTSCLGAMGPIDVDCFKTERGFFISEINPRFGGGYPHAHEMKQNFVKNIIVNLMGEANERQIGNYEEGSLLVKYEHHHVIPRMEGAYCIK